MYNQLISEITDRIARVQKDFSRIPHMSKWAFEKKQEVRLHPQYNHLNFSLYLHVLDILWNINGGMIWEESSAGNYTDDAILGFQEDFTLILKYLSGEKVYQEIILVREEIALDELGKSILAAAQKVIQGSSDINFKHVDTWKETLLEITRENILYLEIVKVIENLVHIYKKTILNVNTIGLLNVSLSKELELDRLSKLVAVVEGRLPYRLSIAVRQFAVMYVNFEPTNVDFSNNVL